MKLETTEEAIKWMVDNPQKRLWNGAYYKYSPDFFVTSAAFLVEEKALGAMVSTSQLPLGPYYTEKPKPERTIEESLERLKGRSFGVAVENSKVAVAAIVRGDGCLVNRPTLQSALSALVDEIEETK